MRERVHVSPIEARLHRERRPVAGRTRGRLHPVVDTAIGVGEVAPAIPPSSRSQIAREPASSAARPASSRPGRLRCRARVRVKTADARSHRQHVVGVSSGWLTARWCRWLQVSTPTQQVGDQENGERPTELLQHGQRVLRTPRNPSSKVSTKSPGRQRRPAFQPADQRIDLDGTKPAACEQARYAR